MDNPKFELPPEARIKFENVIMIGTARTLTDEGLLTDQQLIRVIDKIHEQEREQIKALHD